MTSDGVLWESEGMAHRISLVATGSSRGHVVISVGRIRGTDIDETAILNREDRIGLARALLTDLEKY